MLSLNRFSQVNFNYKENYNLKQQKNNYTSFNNEMDKTSFCSQKKPDHLMMAGAFVVGCLVSALGNVIVTKTAEPKFEAKPDSTAVVDKEVSLDDSNASIEELPILAQSPYANESPILKSPSVTDTLVSGKNKNIKIVVEGDSLTNGYFNSLKKLLGNKVESVNLAHDGDSLGRQIKSQLSSVLSQYDPEKQNVVVLTAGTNDIHNGANANKVYSDLLNMSKILKEKGFKVIVGTCIKLNGSRNNVENSETLAERKKYNDLIRNTPSAPWDKVVDLGSLKEFDDKPESNVTSNHSIYSPDRVHLTEKGYKSMAEAVYKTLQ